MSSKLDTFLKELLFQKIKQSICTSVVLLTAVFFFDPQA